MHTHSHKPKKFKQTSARKMMASFLGEVSSADGRIHAARVHSNVRSTLQNTRAIQNKCYGILASGIVLLHNNARLYTAAHTRALLEHFNWELFGHLLYSTDLAPSDYHLFTYPKNSSIPPVTMLRSSLNMYVSLYIIFFSLFVLLTDRQRLFSA
jgi:hypothetical protein